MTGFGCWRLINPNQAPASESGEPIAAHVHVARAPAARAPAAPRISHPASVIGFGSSDWIRMLAPAQSESDTVLRIR